MNEEQIRHLADRTAVLAATRLHDPASFRQAINDGIREACSITEQSIAAWLSSDGHPADMRIADEIGRREYLR